MKKINIGLILGIAILAPIHSFATVIPLAKTDCAAISKPKTVVLIHASWCAHCKQFMPTYETISNQAQFEDWTFYQMNNDDFESICGVKINGVPATFKNNMKEALYGNQSSQILEHFLNR